MEIQGEDLLIEVLKWTGIVFAAGFVGYFGRYLSMLIIERMHKKKSQQASAAEPVEEKTSSRDDKLEKKKAKLEVKKAKKEKKG